MVLNFDLSQFKGFLAQMAINVLMYWIMIGEWFPEAGCLSGHGDQICQVASRHCSNSISILLSFVGDYSKKIFDLVLHLWSRVPCTVDDYASTEAFCHLIRSKRSISNRQTYRSIYWHLVKSLLLLMWELRKRLRWGFESMDKIASIFFVCVKGEQTNCLIHKCKLLDHGKRRTMLIAKI